MPIGKAARQQVGAPSERKQRVIAARRKCSAVQQRSRETAVQPAATASSKVQKPRRNKSKTKLGLYHVSRRVFVARPASLPEREQRLVLLRPGPFPHAGRWESLATRRSYRGEPRTACAPASLEIITVTCRVRNNRIICQSSDPLEGMAITLNQWILLTARAIQSDAVAPNARRGTRLPSPQVSDVAR